MIGFEAEKERVMLSPLSQSSNLALYEHRECKSSPTKTHPTPHSLLALRFDLITIRLMLRREPEILMSRPEKHLTTTPTPKLATLPFTARTHAHPRKRIPTYLILIQSL